MFREMRRRKQQLSAGECAEILKRNTSGVLALEGDDGYPYAVPLSYAYVAPAGGKGSGAAAQLGALIFHCARTGHKIDAIKRNPKASFCVIDQDEVVPQAFTTYFRSVIAFGHVRIVEDADEKRAAIRTLSDKYSPEETEESVSEEINRFWNTLCLLEFSIAHLTGKAAKELATPPAP